jgi:hypothetical protein
MVIAVDPEEIVSLVGYDPFRVIAVDLEGL